MLGAIKPRHPAECGDGILQRARVGRLMGIQVEQPGQVVTRAAAVQGVMFTMATNRDGDERVAARRVPQVALGVEDQASDGRGLRIPFRIWLCAIVSV